MYTWKKMLPENTPKCQPLQSLSWEIMGGFGSLYLCIFSFLKNMFSDHKEEQKWSQSSLYVRAVKRKDFHLSFKDLSILQGVGRQDLLADVLCEFAPSFQHLLPQLLQSDQTCGSGREADGPWPSRLSQTKPGQKSKKERQHHLWKTIKALSIYGQWF